MREHNSVLTYLDSEPALIPGGIRPGNNGYPGIDAGNYPSRQINFSTVDGQDLYWRVQARAGCPYGPQSNPCKAFSDKNAILIVAF